MHSILLVAQLAVAVHAPLSRADSAALHERLDYTEFVYLWDWRRVWQRGQMALSTAPAAVRAGSGLKVPTGVGCVFEGRIQDDLDRSSWMAHLIKAPNRPKLSLCPAWYKPNATEPPDERISIDAGLGKGPADSVRRLRRPVLALFDSAAKRIPGDGWLTGQRVRLHLDQTEITAARKAATDCRAETWWCAALLGYVEFTAREVSKASATFDRARAAMPDSVRCVWDDASLFLAAAGRERYQQLSCAQRDSVNERVWWLADPLFLENGNERRAEHYAREVLIALHQALDIDERFDWRDNYQGPALREMILRYGWPTRIRSDNFGGIGIELPWSRFDSRSLFLGDYTITVAANSWCNGQPPASFIADTLLTAGRLDTRDGLVACDVDPRTTASTRPNVGAGMHAVPGQGLVPTAATRRSAKIPCFDEDLRIEDNLDDPPCNPFLVRIGIKYWGPQFHTVPLWQTVLDPFHATDEGWDLAPPRYGPYWDTSWWPLEFYRRDAGPLVPFATQAAFFRRQHTAVLAAAMEFDTVTYVGTPPSQVLAGIILSTGPAAPFAIARDTMSGRSPHPIVAAVASGPALLSVEMIPRDGAGAAGRSRFGVDAPAPLAAVAPGALALSDIVLTSARDGEEAPATFAAMLPRMLRSTVLRDPKQTALFWELYGLGTGDTAAISLRIVRKDDDNILQRLGSRLEIGKAADDSLVVQWTEPRPGDPTATLEGGVTIRPRGLVVDMSALSSGAYTVEITVQRGLAPLVKTTRAFRIARH